MKTWLATGAEAAVDTAHDMSMSDDEQTAMTGRAMKFLMPAWESWLRAEIARGSDPVLTAFVMTDVVASLAASHAGTIAKVNRKGQLLLKMRERISSTLKKSARDLRNDLRPTGFEARP